MQRSYDLGRELLKWLAVFTMTIDHVGAALYPDYLLFRYIGRLSFPLFAYLLILGLENTRNVRNYFVRLFLFAWISQIPFYLAFGMQPWEHLNIFFTLSVGLVFIYYFEKKNFLFFIPLLASAVFPFDYGIYGISTVGCFYFLRRNRELGVFLFLLLNLLFLLSLSFQFLALGALPFILLHNDGRISFKRVGMKSNYPLWKKYSFYLYYPLHLLLLYFLK